ncbi:hypothetical protein ACSLPA_32765, partial [Escherichia coli]
MKREGFWRDVTPPLNIYGVPLPFTMIYLLLIPYPPFFLANDFINVMPPCRMGLPGERITQFVSYDDVFPDG